MGWVEADNLGKRYKHYARASDRLLEWALLGQLRRHVETWVLRGATFEISAGEGVGIVGQNGAGKSTLLKIIKGTIQPSEGGLRVGGRLTALELGLGFHPEFSGRENLYTAGALMDLDAATVRRLMPEIEDFAEIGAYIDEPVRTYSSGMQLRLAFSLATAVRPEILIVDEVLAIGDAYFQQKCIARIRGFREEGTTLLLASHDPVAIRTLCDRALLLDGGLLVREGAPDEVLDYYNALVAKLTADHEIRQEQGLGEGRRSTRSGDGRASIDAVELIDGDEVVRSAGVGSPITIRLEGRATTEIEDLTAGISIRDRLGNEVFGTNTHLLGIQPHRVEAGQPFRAEFRLPLNLGVGTYTLTAALHAGRVHLQGNYDWWDQVVVFQVMPSKEPPFVGTAYLPVEARVSTDGGEWTGRG
jgi:lipopolysaccharide transport system ATP-binding protein